MKNTVTLSHIKSIDFSVLFAAIPVVIIALLCYLIGINVHNILLISGVCLLLSFSAYVLSKKGVPESKTIPVNHKMSLHTMSWLDRLDEKTQDELNNSPKADKYIDSLQLLYRDIISLDSSARLDTDGNIIFRYQGGFFQANKVVGADIIRITFPRIYNCKAVRQDILCRTINRLNTAFAICKLTAEAGHGTVEIEVHGVADIIYSSATEERTKLLLDILAVFFEMQRSLLISMSINDTLNDMSDIIEDEGYINSYKNFSLN